MVKAYTADVMVPDFNAPIRLYFASKIKRKMFANIASIYGSKLKLRRGKPLMVTQYDLDITRCNIRHYFSEAIYERFEILVDCI